MPPPTIRLNARAWQAVEDAYTDLLLALGAPDWHGRNLDALSDSLMGDDIDALRAPFTIEIAGVSALSQPLRTWLRSLEQIFVEAAARALPARMESSERRGNGPDSRP